jgi:hypothetical protein
MFQRTGDYSGLGESDQAAAEVWRLLLCYQPQGHPPGGDVVDGAATAVSRRDAVRDEVLV